MCTCCLGVYLLACVCHGVYLLACVCHGVYLLACVCHGVYLLACVCHGVYLLACVCHGVCLMYCGNLAFELYKAVSVVTTIQLTLYENRTIQNKLTTRSVPDPPVRAGYEKNIHPVLQGGPGPETTDSPPFSFSL